ncbi:SLC13/DASS family transporter [Desulfobacter hydrogenophilus]|uniref:SLC13/DASS family transporter n=1 Tax=Desulfobacter hydrogenophilus TaxID=2291 RepID=A0A328FE80_9BACT|nr:SLC13 family permease [Desulfobacter hydrogenophilus]NDY71592.1 SLC13/DASS family transporter [Desulfobacter hydrogenophilus]QBH15369.1 SLC13/DASS family transporter [Desulfobacter hydrogenophilus]RAM02446.1 SLC13/DASS family transporter [Desulfobacter hydrogenophilus]
MTTGNTDAAKTQLDWKRILFILIGLTLFAIVNFSPAWPDAVDPTGKHFMLSAQGKGALAIFLLAGTWWVFEVVPIGVTSLALGALQVLFAVRTAKEALKDFMTPSVLFIFGSLVIGMVFTKTGLTKRLAYKMLAVVGEKTSMIYLGCFVVTAALTHIMAHTAVAATMFPLLMTIYAMYTDEPGPTKFGKGLFMGMAFVAGAGSIVTLLGAARGAVAIGFFKDIVGKDISFFELSYYMFPVGWAMTFILWGFFMILCKPEKKTIPGIKEKAKSLEKAMGGITKQELLAGGIIFLAIGIMSIKQFIPAIADLDKNAIMLVATVLFFIFNILDIKDLETIPWNIILLFGGAMSIGFCLWETGAAEWLAINWLTMFQNANYFVFILSIAFFVMIMTNFIMNVAAIAISLPVALVIAPYLNVAPEVILFASLVTAGMPFLLLVGAAPNAIAYDSKQFTTGEFFMYGIPASIILMVLVAVSIFMWKIMGMPITTV